MVYAVLGLGYLAGVLRRFVAFFVLVVVAWFSTPMSARCWLFGGDFVFGMFGVFCDDLLRFSFLWTLSGSPRLRCALLVVLWWFWVWCFGWCFGLRGCGFAD